MAGSFELFTDPQHRIRFRLLAPDGTVLVVSGPFSDRGSATSAIMEVRECAGTGLIEDHSTAAHTLSLAARARLHHQRAPRRTPSRTATHPKADEDLDSQLVLVLDSDDTRTVLTGLAVLAERTLSSAIPALDCSITLIRPKKHPVQASSGTLALFLDELQDSLGEGPTLTAITEHRTVVVPDLAEDDRWPRLAALAPRRGIRSALAVPLAMEGQDRAVLNLSSGRAHAFTSENVHAAEAFAGQASRVLRPAVRIARLNDAVHDLHSALKHRAVIDTALGVVMSQNRCDHDTAFTILQHAASTRNVKLRDVAASIVASVSGQSSVTVHFDP